MSSFGRRVKPWFLAARRYDRVDKSTHPPQPPKTDESDPMAHSTIQKAVLEAVSERNQANSPFLQLPAEIRNKIYLYAFGGHEIYAMPSGLRPFVCMGRPNHQFAWSLKPAAQIMALHLPLVCRQIRSETGKYFAFKFNTFGSTEPQYFKRLIDSLTLEQRRSIEVVKVNYVRGRWSGSSAEARVGYLELRELMKLKRVVLRDMDGMDAEATFKAVSGIRLAAGKEGLQVQIERVGC